MNSTVLTSTEGLKVFAYRAREGGPFFSWKEITLVSTSKGAGDLDISADGGIH